jgi:sialidase-1
MNHPSLRFFKSFIAATAVLLSANVHQSFAESPRKTDVFVSGKGGYHTYRIPALILSKKGTLLAFCEGRKNGRGDHGNLDMVLRRSTDGGKTWLPTQLVYEEGGSKKITIGNPCPVVDQSTGRIWLPFCRDNNDVLMTYSDDDGKSWVKPKVITKNVKKANWGWYATGPGVGIQLQHGPHKGRLVIPSDHKTTGKNPTFYSHVIYSDDHGKTWQLGGVADKHTNECQVVELNDGTLMLNMRNYWGRNGKVASRGGMRAVALSKNGGQSWGPLLFDKTLIESICQASLLKFPTEGKSEKTYLLFSNPASKSRRHQLTVRLSNNAGKSWANSQVLHPGPSAYSCLTILPDGSIGFLYEGGKKHAYEKIIFARFSLQWLSAGKPTTK